MSTASAASRGMLARADLLRLLAAADRPTLTLEDSQDGWFGYLRKQDDTQMLVAPHAVQLQVAPVTQVAAPPRSKLQMPHVFAVVHREQLEPPAVLARRRTPVPVLTDEHLRPRSLTRQVNYEDLIPSARLMPALVRALGATRGGALDVDRLIAELCVNRVPRYLPRQRRQGWHPELVVVLDFCDRLFPFRHDMHRLARRLRRACGRSAVSLRVINHGPAGSWSDWVAEQNRQRLAPLQPWRMPAAGTPVLIVSDLGFSLPAGAPSQLCEDWQQFIARLQRANLRPVALAPVGSSQVGELAQRLPILRWSPDARLQPVRGRSRVHEPPGLKHLLAAIALCRRVDPPLLRALRRLNPLAAHNAGLEAAVWSHPDVSAMTMATVRSECMPRYTQVPESRLPSMGLQLHKLQRLHHAHLPRALEYEETLLLAAHADHESLQRSPVQHHLEQAQYFLHQLRQTLADPEASPVIKQQCERIIRAILQRADVSMHERFPEELFALQEALVPYSGDTAAALQCWIVFDVRSSEIRLQAQRGSAQQFVLNDALSIDTRGLIVRVGDSNHWNVRLVSRGELPLVIAQSNSREMVQLKTSRDLLTLGPIRRPRGLQRWWCDQDGIQLRGASLCRRPAEFTSYWPTRREPHWLWVDEAAGSSDAHRDQRPVAEAVGSQDGARYWRFMAHGPGFFGRLVPGRPFFGFDEFGLYADLLIQGGHGRATQRFRFIEPGTFQMGSSQEEPEQYENEGPQHPVTLTQGFWLADTACTQALWRAVMGSNPSRFKGDELPVETVSWHDVQKFLRELDPLLPDFRADLPTEAEWEYACRAGTPHPFSFGENITPAQVNYDGNYPYARGDKGEYRECTVPVKGLPGNPWGLYEMHGNVWEWCSDGLRKYGDTAVVDPVGMFDVATYRALRGGSWIGNGGHVRSAYRYALEPSSRYGYIGFRLCSRSSQSGAVASRPPTGTRWKNSRAKSRSPSNSWSKK